MTNFKTHLILDSSPSFAMPFAEWLEENCKMSPIKFIANPRKKYLADCLNDDVPYGKPLSLKYARPERPIFISAPTGAGKNFYIQHYILGPLLERNKGLRIDVHEKILLLSNRVALGRQSKIEIARFIRERTGESKYLKYISSLKDTAQDAVDSMNDFGDIIICSYQQIASMSQDFYTINFKYVILDEAHFFTSDAVFNTGTSKTLNKLLPTFLNAIRIYMSSTLENVFEPIIRKEVELYQKRHPLLTDKRLFIEYYDLERNYDFLDIKVLPHDVDISEEISRCIGKGKWLVFVSSKKDGEDLKRRLSSKGNAAFITAEDKTSKAYRSIITEEKFPEGLDVLISTAVIDNGINIKDDSVTNVLICIPDRVELIQMLGRLRFNKKSPHRVNLFLVDFDLNTLKSTWRADVNKLLERLQYEMDGSLPSEEQRHVHTLDIAPESKINPLSIYQLLARIEDVSRMIKALSPNEPLVLNDSERDRQLKIFDWLYYQKPHDILSKRICDALKGVKAPTLVEGDIQTGDITYVHPTLSEKSFLKIIREKRASALEHDAIDIIETMRIRDYGTLKTARLKKLSAYHEILQAREHYEKFPPDGIHDMPWDCSNIWDDYKKALYIQDGTSDLPDAAYLREKHDLYNELSKNNIQQHPNGISPVILEQLHWLDMVALPKSSTTDDTAASNDTPTDALTAEQVATLLKHTFPEEDVLKNSEKKDWVKQHGYSLKTLNKIASGDTSCATEGGGLSSIELRKLFVFFQKYYFAGQKISTFNQLLNRLKKSDYLFDCCGKKYSFKILSAQAASHATHYIFYRKLQK